MTEGTIETVTIPKREYEEMQNRLRWLNCLEAAGVDNWQGTDTASDMYHEEDED